MISCYTVRPTPSVQFVAAVHDPALLSQVLADLLPFAPSGAVDHRPATPDEVKAATQSLRRQDMSWGAIAVI